MDHPHRHSHCGRNADFVDPKGRFTRQLALVLDSWSSRSRLVLVVTPAADRNASSVGGDPQSDGVACAAVVVDASHIVEGLADLDLAHRVVARAPLAGTVEAVVVPQVLLPLARPIGGGGVRHAKLLPLLDVPQCDEREVRAGAALCLARRAVAMHSAARLAVKRGVRVARVVEEVQHADEARGRELVRLASEHGVDIALVAVEHIEELLARHARL
eukprot:CAMPEP_0182818584 /NCGR_PEP_ID=MMETSP0006_2-20121128/12098_1 /TAXON_ID=97485 /ORGANISM="Prymnesium parvum, Strain Texoma1" /LENGTH=215 /DNA_ID=CAMNT_0024945051 /DNA_START=306 /DNA_END=949 /DNA_ORIENTATION=+